MQLRLDPDQFWTYWEWLFVQNGLINALLLSVLLGLIGFVIAYLVALVRHGPGEGFFVVARTIAELFKVDLPGSSPRRIFAIAKLAFKEAIRRRVLVVVAVFVVGLMFAGWFLTSTDNPARLYISFVLTGTNYLLLLLGLFLACFSLPADIKSRTIYTIVTKPVRPNELLLGRMLGFIAVGTVILLVLGSLSFVFVTRGVNHSHEVVFFNPDQGEGETSRDLGHAHRFVADDGLTDEQGGHLHRLEAVTGPDGQVTYRLSPPQLLARIPVYGRLSFTDRDGAQSGAGINVGYEDEYQQWIEGNSLMSAIWTFSDVRPARFGQDELTLEMTLGAFRTYKGDIVTGVQGEIILQSADGRARADSRRFVVREFKSDVHRIPRKLSGFVDGQPRELDLYDDLAADGKLQVIIRCIDNGQYFGMANADLFLRAGDQPFWWNFFKGYVSLWLQMVIVVCLGVMFSTFLNGPVAMVATLAAILLGFFGVLARDILTGAVMGGGPIESVIRLVTQKGVMVDLELGNQPLQVAIERADAGVMYLLYLLTAALPDFRQLATADFVAFGVNIFGGLLSRHLTIAAGYFLLTTIVGYFFLKTREMAG